MPPGLRDRIRNAAQRSGRSMNTEIVAALESFYPEEPTVEEVLDRVHDAIEMARNTQAMPYRKVLIEALDQLSQQISGGMEPDQFRAPHIGPEYKSAGKFIDRYRRWQRAQKDGVETQDFERELERGMFSNIPGDRVLQLLKWFENGRSDLVLKNLRLSETKFVDEATILARLHKHFDRFYRENWGDPNNPPPWNGEEF